MNAPTPNRTLAAVKERIPTDSKTLGIAALVFGILAIVAGSYPGWSFVAWIPAALGLITGILALKHRTPARKRAIWGVALSGLGWLVAFTVSMAAIGAALGGGEEGADATSAPSPSASSTPTATPSPSPSDEDEDDEAAEETPLDPDEVATPDHEPKVGANAPAPGGTALALLETLPVKGKAPKTGYDRTGKFGSAWTDVDRNGCDTRNDILQRDLTAITLSGSCKVMSGMLIDPYTGKHISFMRGQTTSIAVQIDHVVALMNAWETGAQQLTQEQRVSLANDPINLLAVDGPTNGKKGASDAASWLPPQKGFRCEYVARQISVKATYGLWVTAAERNAMQNVLASCPNQPAISSSFAPKPAPPAPAPAPAPPKPAAPVPAPAPPPAPPKPTPAPPAPPTNVYYKNCTAARDAGAAPVHRGDPGYGKHLDRDGDGIGCE